MSRSNRTSYDMDSESGTDVEEFAQNILERARLRRQMFNSSGMSGPPDRGPTRHNVQVSKSRLQESSSNPHRIQATHIEKTKSPNKGIPSPIGKNSANPERALQNPEDSDDNNGNQVDMDSKENSEVRDDHEEEDVNAAASLGRCQNYNRLGKLYSSDQSIKSQVYGHNALEKTPEKTPLISTGQVTGPAGRISRLNALASTINAWEDDLTHFTSSTSRFNISHPKRQSGVGVSSKRSALTSPNALVSSQSESNPNAVRKPPAFVYGDKFNKLGLINDTSPVRDNEESAFGVRYAENIKSVSVNSSPVLVRRTRQNEQNTNETNAKFSPNVWDQSVLSALEAQGFVSNPSKTKLVYEYNENSDMRRLNHHTPPKVIAIPSTPVLPKSPSKVNFRNTLVEEKTFPRDTRSRSASPSKSDLSSYAVQITTNVTSTKEKKSWKNKKNDPSGPNSSTNTTGRNWLPNRKFSSSRAFNLSVSEKTALFESKVRSSTVLRDPAEMTVAEKAQLFEKQALFANRQNSKGYIKPPIVFPAKVSSFVSTNPPPCSSPMKVSTGSVENQRRLFEAGLRKNDSDPSETSESEYYEDEQRSPTNQSNIDYENVMTPPPHPPPPPPMANFGTKSSLIVTPDSSHTLQPQTLITPRGRNATPKRSASPSPTRTISPKMKYPGSRDVKRIRINEPKPGRMYPSLTDIETTETETETEIDIALGADEDVEYDDEDMESETSHISGSSLGTQIEREAKRHAFPIQRRNPDHRPTEDFNTSLACQQIDAFIDDALEGQDYTLLDTVIEAEFYAATSSIAIPNNLNIDGSKIPTPPNTDWKMSNEVTRKSLLAEDASTIELEDYLSVCTIDVHQCERIQEEKTDINGDSGSNFCNANESDINNDSKPNHIRSNNDISMDLDGDKSDPELQIPLAFNQKQDSSAMMTSSPLFTKSKASPIGTPLMHTVSVYRKQQVQSTTPGASKQVLGRVDTKQRAPSPPKPVAENAAVNDRIRKLNDEVSSQQRAIAQVSKALNLCKSTVEFSESTENVECERVLLIATQKRTAILNEIHRLKTEGVLSGMAVISPSKHDLSPSCRGNMKLSDLGVQLKREFLNKVMTGDSVYHFLSMIRYRNHLEASLLVSMGSGLNSSRIQGGLLNFSNSFAIPNLEPDFQVKLEIYVLQTLKEFLPHEAKYHIKREAKLKMTPKKSKEVNSSKALSRGFQQSPAGPGAVRTSNFTLCGSISIDISTLQRTHWNLEGVRYSSPLEGSASFRIQCSAEGGVEERGFLTLFDDVSGFGAWHRRWCKLTPTQLAFWMYPEDENKKVPLGAIQLRHCVTSHVGSVTREVCARPNTFLLVTTRSRMDGDKDSLVTSCHLDYTAIRHLISADMREERDLWCKMVNRALANLRAWDPQAHSPDDTLF